jgi:two-component system, cell cycle response regulator DivK
VTRRVLLVEDDALSLKLMRDVLQAHWYETVEATSGLDALQLASDVVPDLVIMDIGLPGIDGVEATRRLKAAPATAAIPVVAVTAFAMAGDEDRMREAGCDAHFTKPLRLTELVSTVESLLSRVTP